MLARGDKVMICSGDPTAYLRFGRSATPPGGTRGTVTGTALVVLRSSSQSRAVTQVAVRWRDGTEGLYLKSALVKIV